MKNLADVSIGNSFLGKTHFLTQTTGAGTLVSVIASNAFVLAGIIVLFIFVLGGIGIIAGAGNNDPEQIEKGKKTLTSALIGFLVVFTAYWIVQLIGKLTGINILG